MNVTKYKGKANMIKFAAWFYLIVICQFAGTVQAVDANDTNKCKLDWQLISEIFAAKMNFCTTVPVSKIQNTTATSSTFAFDPNVSEVKLSYPAKLNKDIVSVKIALWQDKQWVKWSILR